MIRLIATDMDGTLLGEDGRVPEETFDLIRRLRRLGIAFVPASGRIHDVLRVQFGPVADEIDYVCSNGGEVWVGGRRVFRAGFAGQDLADLIDELARRPHVSSFMSDGHTTFVFGERSGKLMRWFEDDDAFESVARGLPPEGTEIIKISLHVDESRVAEEARELHALLGDRLVFHVAAHDFIDVQPVGVDKGLGLARVLEARGIEPEEVLAFGDAMNDKMMLELAGEAVAMANALPEVQAICDRVIGTYQEGAVQKELARIVERLEHEQASGEGPAEARGGEDG